MPERSSNFVKCSLCGVLVQKPKCRLKRRPNTFCKRDCFEAFFKDKRKSGYKRPPFSKEWKENLSKGHVGQVAWNKGLKGYRAGEKHDWMPEGEAHWSYIKDRTKLKKSTNGNKYRNSPAHKEWSRSVKNRDGWKCRLLNSECSGRLVSHHIIPWRESELLRYEVNNGITLCHNHHPRKKDDEKRLAPVFQEIVKAK